MSTLSSNTVVLKYDVQGLEQIERVSQGFTGISKEERETLAQLKKLNTGLKDVASQGTQTTKEIQSGFAGINSSVRGIGGLLAVVFAVGQIKAFAKEVIDTTVKFEQYRKSIDFATGSSENGAKAFQFLTDTAQKYGLSLRALTEGYKGFSASSVLAGTSIEETNRQFLAIAKAASTLGLSADKTSLVLNGLSQIASKGTVSMEELRGQIGDQLPGSLGIAARAMGMTSAAFNKFVSDGKLASDVFLPKFATELEKTFGPSADKNLKTLTASQNRFNSSIDLLILSVGNKLEPFLKGAFDLASGIATQLASIGVDENAEAAKKNTVDQVAARRTYNEYFAKTLEYGVTETETNAKALRQKIGTIQLLEMGQKIELQLSRNAEQRIRAANKYDLQAQKSLKQGERELAILYEQEKILEKQVGIYVIAPKITALAFTKEQYAAELKLLDLEEKIALIRAKIAEPNAINLATAELKIKEKFGVLKLAVDDKFIKATIEKNKAAIESKIADESDAAKEEIAGAVKVKEERGVQLELTREETVRTLKETTQDAKAEIQKQLEDMNAFENKKTEDQKESVKKQEDLNRELVSLEDQKAAAIKAINDKRKKEEEADRVEAIKEAVEVTQATVEVLSTIYQGFYNIRQQQIQNELSAIQFTSDEQVRLADGNEQKINTIREKQAQKERELRIKQFQAQKAQAIANVVFRVAPYVAEYLASGFLAPLAAGAIAAGAVEIALIAAQPIPAFKEGTEKPHTGYAIVGDGGQKELMVTKSGKVAWSPATDTLVNFKEPTQVFPEGKIPQEYFYSGVVARKQTSNSDNAILKQLGVINKTLEKLPVSKIEMDKKGFKTFVQTRDRSTEILDNQFG